MIAVERVGKPLPQASLSSVARPRVCFLALNAYAVLSGRTDLPHLGGAETQLALIGRELRRRGYPVSFLVLDHGQPDGVEHDGLRVFKTFRPDAGVPGLRFMHPRITGLWRAMSRADADVYVQRMADSDTGVAAAWCRWNRRRFVFCTASDTDCARSLPDLRTWRERIAYRYGLRHANRVVTQTCIQQRQMHDQFGVASTWIPSGAACPGRDERAAWPHRDSESRRVLWVGRFAPVKRLELYLDVAERCPEFKFEIVGDAKSDEPGTRKTQRRAASIVNVVLHGRVPYARIGERYRRAHVLMCTSMWEGFPNTFLEAWSRGVPTVSTVDPDNVIATNALGGLATDAASLAAAVRGLLAQRATWEAFSQRAREYFQQHHTLDAAVGAYETVLRELVG